MLANVFTKSFRDRLGGIGIGSVSIVVLLAFGILVYREVDVSFYYTLPAAILDLMGIPETGDLAGLIFGSMYNLIGALTLASLAISIGAASIAGEEARGTMGILLGNPKSRTYVYVSKAGSQILLVAVGTLVLWAGGLAAASVFDIDMTGIYLGALCIHLFVNSLFYGFLALAIGAWTGSRSKASGLAVAVMLVSYLAAGILPLVESLDWLARLFPWYYFSDPAPVANGIDWGALALLSGGVVALFAVGLYGINHRDLREHGVSVKLIDRLRAHPMTQRLAEKIAGSARVSSIWVKTASEHQGILVITGAIMFYMSLLIGPLFGLLPPEFTSVIEDFPDVLLAMIGSANLATPEGFYQSEVFSLVGPIAFIVVTAAMGSRALAGEEEERTMGLLMANPITRARVISEKVVAMVAYSFVLGAITFIGTWAGVLLGGLGIAPWNIASITILLVLLSLVFGSVALALSAATGRTRIASFGAAGVAIVAYFVNSFLPLVDRIAGWARWSPFHYYLSGDPLQNGLNWAHAGALLAIFAGLVTISYPLFQRRDLLG